MLITCNRLFVAIIGVILESVYTFPTTHTIMFLTCRKLFVAFIGVVFTQCAIQEVRMCSLLAAHCTWLSMVSFSTQCITTLQQLRIWCSLHTIVCLRLSLMSCSACFLPNNSYEYIPYMQNIVRDNHCCRFLLVHTTVTNMFLTSRRLFPTVIVVVFSLYVTAITSMFLTYRILFATTIIRCCVFPFFLFFFLSFFLFLSCTYNSYD